MTTIAYDYKKKTISVDGRTTQGNSIIVHDEASKTRENEQGMWFICGNRAQTEDFIRLENGGQIKGNLQDWDIAAFLLDSKGQVFYIYLNDSGISEWLPINHSDALGSGAPYAIAAMDFGKSSAEAVAYASTRNIHTGGKITTVDIEEYLCKQV
ncbi:hypothetical protein F9L16_23500 [Agarivorans sp. B2Z047]|uniref:hypothetical protein n=1 Tax=Agarivorans sp. B2Z047 TaxID=2652721 RepID=UPI00128DBEFF|nr:hypothetical protein [Agarivorans sp. B2Z047]MPW31923.1 hypothetical protein [Agarivorans sp. B2Z047]UQN41892.1 hypothetical protein LQZ07_19250 [Agarivorans sp. B2Z047]